MQKPKPHSGLRHLALNVKNFAECSYFYTELLGMKVVWQPDQDNLYLNSGSDNLALHKAKSDADGPATFGPPWIFLGSTGRS